MDYSNYTAQPQVPQPNTPMFQPQEGYQPQLYEPQGPQMNNYGMAGPGMLPPATGAGFDFSRLQHQNRRAVNSAKCAAVDFTVHKVVFFIVYVGILAMIVFGVALPLILGLEPFSYKKHRF